jgi:hypothetical protein
MTSVLNHSSKLQFLALRYPPPQLRSSSSSSSGRNTRDSWAMQLRASSRLLATAASIGKPKGLRPAPMALLPPIPLYRRLLRAHRKYLPVEMRLLGDQYIKSEFRAHRDVENPVHIVSGYLPPEEGGLQRNVTGDN